MVGKPVVWSAGGTGTALRSCTRLDGDGVFEATKWVTVAFLPILPLHRARYRLIERRTTFPAWRQLYVEHLGDRDLALWGVLRTYLLAWVVVPAAIWVPTGLLGLPGILVGRLDLAAVGAVLSSAWVIPFALGVTLWTIGQPWPVKLPRPSDGQTDAEFRRSVRVIGSAFGITFLLVGGTGAGLSVVVDLIGGLGLQVALLGGLQVVAFFAALMVLTAFLFVFSMAWKAAQDV